MGSRRAIRKLATGAALAATVVSLAVSAPAAAVDTDRYGNKLLFSTACNPSVAEVGGLWGFQGGGGQQVPLFKNGLAWVDYFGTPVAFSPFTMQLRITRGGTFSHYQWPVPSPSRVPRGRYTLNVLLQLNSDAFHPLTPGGLFGSLVFTTLSEKTTIDPALNTDCTPIGASASASRAAARKPSERVLARRVQALRGSDMWLERSSGPHATYPKGRFCGETICVQRRPGGPWKPIARR